ncbi:MAG: hypothetical protein U0872_00125 [Planctomycetaceae bacterium]
MLHAASHLKLWTWSLYHGWPVRQRWMRFAACLVGLANVLWIRHGYLTNDGVMFFAGLATSVAMAAAWLHGETGSVARLGWQIWQRGAAGCLALTLLEGSYFLHQTFWNRADGTRDSAQVPAVMTYAEAQGDPHAFSQWWQAYVREWSRNADQIEERVVNGPVPYRFRPNTSRPFFQGQIQVNSLGLCDREVPLDKGNRYRIVVMGSSHTQCPPIAADDEPWPTKLERCLRSRLPAGREIEVLNAGAAGYTIEHNLHRLRDVVLPLKPDLIITYFGYNEFHQFQHEFRLPAIPPLPRSRPSTLLSHAEWRFHQWIVRQGTAPESLSDLDSLQPRLVQSRLANVYREYQRVAQEQGIPLVVCNFCMAVNEQSPDEAVRFYEQGFPDVQYMIQANRLNSAMLPAVFADAGGSRLIDVQPHLDGAWEQHYLDLVHLSEVGKQQLAENVYEGIRDLLKPALLPETPAPARQLANEDVENRPR